jgi:hypothetical protein
MASERERFRKFYDRESGVTRKVLSAFPGHEADFKPHDRSNSAKALASTFVIEQIMILKALFSRGLRTRRTTISTARSCSSLDLAKPATSPSPIS